MPSQYREVMERYAKEKSDFADVVRISTFNIKSRIHQEVARTGKTCYIADSRRLESFQQSDNNDLIDLKKFYGDSFIQEREKMMSKEISRNLEISDSLIIEVIQSSCGDFLRSNENHLPHQITGDLNG